MQTTRFENQTAHNRMFEVLFHHLFVCYQTSAKQQLRSGTSGTSAGTQKSSLKESYKLLYQRTSMKTRVEAGKKKTKKNGWSPSNICRQRGLKNQACASSYV